MYLCRSSCERRIAAELSRSTTAASSADSEVTLAPTKDENAGPVLTICRCG